MRKGLAAAAKKASAQKGVITRGQLLGVGVRSSAIGRWVDKGLLTPEYAGVYRFGHTAPSVEATYMAAVLAAGDGALLARRAAGHLMRLLKGAPPPPEIVGPIKRRIASLDTKHDYRLHQGMRRNGEASPQP